MTYENPDEQKVIRHDIDPVAEHDVQNELHTDKDEDKAIGAEIGGVGGAITGAAAGAMVGPLGAVAGAIVGGIVGAAGSSAAVGAVHNYTQDDPDLPLQQTVIPTGEEVDASNTAVTRTYTGDTVEEDDEYDDTENITNRAVVVPPTNPGFTADPTHPGMVVPPAGSVDPVNSDLGVNPTDLRPELQHQNVEDTRGLGERAVDALTGDTIDDKTGRDFTAPHSQQSDTRPEER